jgi:acyl-CoA oxidase
MASILEENRILSKVQTSKMSLLLYSGQDRLDSLRRIWSKIEVDPEFDKSERLNMNHAERYVDACRKIKRFQEIADEENFQTLDEMYDAYMAVDENLPIDVHLSMFIPIMTLHTSPEQKERWLEAAKTFRIIGAYAQTELAHGSNVRGIETTAIYDIDTDEFVINTPSLTSAKWWPGGLGHTATHAIVYANLILKKKNFGPHPFMVQLRSLKDHTPLPNVMLGDLGPKQGYNSMDNGFAIFDNIRIPRMDMLMGFAYVSSSGEYSKKEGAEKIAFGIMLDVRARICMNSAYVLARVLTISIRYSCLRVQGFVDPSGRNAMERSVLDYPTQQRVLMPLLAFAYALHFTGEDVKRFYSFYTVSGDASVLSELHASSAGLKSYITAHVSEGMEACRKMCGGHGFLVNAGFAELYTSYLPFSTLEGTKEVLQQQTGRFLLKQYILALKVFHTNEKNVLQSKNISSPMAPSTEYLLECLERKKLKESKINFSFLLQILEKHSEEFTNEEYTLIEEELLFTHQIRSSWCVVNSAIVVEKSKKIQIENERLNLQKNTPETKNTEIENNSIRNQNFNSRILDPLLSASVELCVAAESHSELLILQSFANKIKKQISVR